MRIKINHYLIIFTTFVLILFEDCFVVCDTSCHYRFFVCDCYYDGIMILYLSGKFIISNYLDWNWSPFCSLMDYNVY